MAELLSLPFKHLNPNQSAVPTTTNTRRPPAANAASRDMRNGPAGSVSSLCEAIAKLELKTGPVFLASQTPCPWSWEHHLSSLNAYTTPFRYLCVGTYDEPH